ncbi:methylated-DNA--[protein]-cysteine S-methyltransferase [Sphingosinicella sp. CPCC 101087]|uniref:methylated-DNA--[protein]-cysteine S-methyltransferase n=1 Tax=Sphingosinicella sp. CPCC 101087 TaxID=2497754 RepID=UPI00101BBBA4|nr:methylated-DNA--[protein]-cysteine S-methyltransferase [Sphingosinicella sp. CPCC 101087]
MTESGFILFDTAIGRCGLAWSPAGLKAVQLPEASDGKGLERLKQFRDLEPGEPPAWVAQAVASIRAHLASGRVDLSGIELDYSAVPPFEASVYREARRIPAGSTLSYGELASRLGDRNQARAVGQALGRNPWPIVIPCHRVTASAGRTGGFSAPGGTATKLKLLEIEGALAAETLPLFRAPV